MIVVDTTELARHTQRKLHAAWWELKGKPLLATPGVAEELAPLGAPGAARAGMKASDNLAALIREAQSEQRKGRLRIQQWWAKQWEDPQSPYGIAKLNAQQEEIRAAVLEEIDERCFPGVDTIELHADARIVAESMALGAKMLLTSDMRTMDRVRVNEWAKVNGDRLGFPAQDVLYPADETLVQWTRTPGAVEKWLQAGMIACWPARDDAPATEVVKETLARIDRMRSGSGGKLVNAAGRLINELRAHPDPIGLVEETRKLLPSATIDSERGHPTCQLR